MYVFTFDKNSRVSHNISAFCRKSGRKISTISIDPFNQGKSWLLYESLNCSDCNSGVTGSGTSRVISEDKLKVSISKFRYLLGEPENETYEIVKHSSPCRSASNILNRVLRAIGSRPSSGDIKIILDRESAEDIERFLIDIQNRGDLLVEFN